jgi:hypothetical protein
MKLLAFLVKTTDRLVPRVILSALFGGLLTAGVALLVAYEGTLKWPPQQLTGVAAIALAAFAAYAAAVSVLLSAALHALVQAKDAAPSREQGVGVVGGVDNREHQA